MKDKSNLGIDDSCIVISTSIFLYPTAN